MTIIGCARKRESYRTFADYPGFEEYFAGRCVDENGYHSPVESERKLLYRYRPRIILPPGGRYPIDFYRDYIPFTVMRRHSDKEVMVERVTPEILRENQNNREVYLEFQKEKFRESGHDKQVGAGIREKGVSEEKPVLYGRVYREKVPFPCDEGQTCYLNLTFLKYNIVFATSGLAAELPAGYEFLLKLMGLDPEDWHDLDNFVAVHIVLDDEEKPVAALLAQHNHHRTYLIGSDIPHPQNGRLSFDVALRSNEIYPASNSEEAVKHRVVQWAIHMKYLLSGEDPPRYRGHDVTRGINAGGMEIDFELKFLSPCDPFYRAGIMLGEPRPFFGKYIGRDGPPGSDYYTIPPLLPLGNLLKFSYLRDGDPDDIKLIEDAIDVDEKNMDTEKIMDYGGRKFYRDVRETKKTMNSGSF